MRSIFYLVIILLSISCTSHGNKTTGTKDVVQSIVEAQQIGAYVIEIFEDSQGNLWVGTLEKGVAKYDGESLRYFSVQDGLPGNGVSSILEDKQGNLWFGTHSGLSKYDGKTFTNFTEEDGLCHFRVSNILIDSQDIFWIGTWGGVCTFDGTAFTSFSIPNPVIETQINEDTKHWITDIMEDSKGNIWIGRDGYGACKYDGETFAHFTTKEGIYSNNVQEIVEDNNGNIWFGTRVAEKDNPDPNKRFGKGGITKYDDENFSHFPEIEGLNDNDTYAIYKDHSGNIWMSTIKHGVYKYDGKAFVNYKVPIPIMTMTEDKDGKLWVGGSGGLYSISSKGIVTNVTTNGPWK